MSLLRKFFKEVVGKSPHGKLPSKDNPPAAAGATSNTTGLIDPFAEEEKSTTRDDRKTPASGGLIDPFAEEGKSKARHDGKAPASGGLIDPFAEEKKSKRSGGGKEPSSGGLIDPFAEDKPAPAAAAGKGKKGAATEAPADDSEARAKKFFDEAEALYKKKQYAKAAESYKSAYKLVKGDGRGQLAFNVAQAYRMAKNTASAAAWYQKALVLGGSGVAAYREEIHQRLDEMLGGVQKDPMGEGVGMARILFEQGEIAYGDGDYAQAEVFYKKAYESTKEPNLLFNVAQCCRLERKYADAKSYYREYLRLAPDTPYKDEIEKHIEELKKKAPDPPK